MTTQNSVAHITGLHHAGLVVADITAARTAYARLGFVVPPATFPALPPAPGQQPQAFGAGNAHITFASNFLELATVVDDTTGTHRTFRGAGSEDHRLHIIHAPDAVLERLTAVIADTTDRLRSALDRFEGLHILAFQTFDADAAASYLRSADVSNSGVQRLHRPIETADGERNEPIGYLELDDPKNTPEGRLAVAENPPAEVLAGQLVPDHPNGATALTELRLSVPDADLDSVVGRYRRYLERRIRPEGPSLAFDLNGSRVVLTPTSRLQEVLPGETARTDGPAIAGCTLAVDDLDVTADLLRTNDVVFHRADGHLMVASADAAGAALTFTQSMD